MAQSYSTPLAAPPPAEPAKQAEASTAPPTQEPAPAATVAPTQSGGEPLPVDRPPAAAKLDLQINPYAVQVRAARSLATLKTFLKNSGVDAAAYYREETYRGRPLFVLIYSLHPSQEAANAAVKAIPRALDSDRVVVRRLPADAKLRPLGP